MSARDLSFDRYQFERPTYANEVADLTLTEAHDWMQTASHKGRPDRWVPQFANNANQLRHVLLYKAWVFLNHRNTGQPLPESVSRELLDRLATAKAVRPYDIADGVSEKKRQEHAAFAEAVRRAGSYIALHAAIASLAWHERMDCVSIAQELGGYVTPWQVRQYLRRLVVVARHLGYPTMQPHWTAGRRVPRRRKVAA